MSDREHIWADLMRRANRGDGAAYARLLSEAAPVLRRVIAARALCPSAETEDVVQDVLLALHTRRHTWRETEPLLPWLYAIARYKAVDAARRRGWRVNVQIDKLAEVLADDAPGDTTAARDVARLLGGLDRRSALIVEAIGVQERSAAEVGARTGLSEGAVRVAYHRAMVRLRQMVGADGGADE